MMEEIESTVFRNHLTQLQSEKWFGEEVFQVEGKKICQLRAKTA